MIRFDLFRCSFSVACSPFIFIFIMRATCDRRPVEAQAFHLIFFVFFCNFDCLDRATPLCGLHFICFVRKSNTIIWMINHFRWRQRLQQFAIIHILIDYHSFQSLIINGSHFRLLLTLNSSCSGSTVTTCNTERSPRWISIIPSIAKQPKTNSVWRRIYRLECIPVPLMMR